MSSYFYKNKKKKDLNKNLVTFFKKITKGKKLVTFF